MTTPTGTNGHAGSASPVGNEVGVVNDSSRQRILYLVAAVAQGLGAVAVQPFAIRILDPIQWGQVSLMLSLIAVSLVAITAGFPMSVSAFYFEPKNGKQKARSLTGFGILFSIIAAVIATTVYLLVSTSGGSSGADILYLIVIAIIALHGVSQMTLAFLRSDQRPLSFVIVIVLATVTGHVAGLFTILYVSATATAYLTSFALSVFASAVLGVLLARPSRPFAQPDALRGAIRMSLPVLPHSIALIVMQQGESLLINAFQGEVLVGRYNAVLPFALGPLAVILALANVWQTVLLSLRGRDEHGQGRRIQAEAYFVGFLLTLGGSGVAVLASYVLVNDPEPELLALARIFPLLGFGYIMYILATSQLFAIGKTISMGYITPTIAVAALAVATWPASTGDLVLVGVIKVASYLALGLWFFIVVRRIRSDLLELRPMLIWLAASITVTLLMSALPATLFVGTITATSVCLVGLAAVTIYFVRSRRATASTH